MSFFQERTVELLQINLRHSIAYFQTKIDSFQVRGSGWIIKNIEKIELEIVQTDYFATGSFIALQFKLQRKRYLFST